MNMPKRAWRNQSRRGSGWPEAGGGGLGGVPALGSEVQAATAARTRPSTRATMGLLLVMAGPRGWRRSLPGTGDEVGEAGVDELAAAGLVEVDGDGVRAGVEGGAGGVAEGLVAVGGEVAP